MVVPIFPFGDNPIWFKLLIVAICLYFLGRSLRSEGFYKIGSFVRSGGSSLSFYQGSPCFFRSSPFEPRCTNNPASTPIKAPTGPVTKADVITISRSLSCTLPEKSETRTPPSAAPAA